MKDFGDPARAALAAGGAIGVGIVDIDCQPDPVRAWGGYGDQLVDGATFTGVGDRGLVDVVGSAVGDTEQNITLTLSGVDPMMLAAFDMSSLRRAPVVCYRGIFDPVGQNLLAAPVFARGRLDTAPKQETAGADATVSALVETAARGLGRGGGRSRSAADQALVDSADDGFKGVSYAGQVPIYWGGKVPQTAQQALGGVPPGVAAGIVAGQLF